MWETIKNDPILKTVTIIILSVLGFGFAFNIMFGSNSHGMGQMGEMGGGAYSLGNTLSTVFILAFKVLLIVLVVAAIIAIIKLARKYISGGGEIKVIESIKKDPVLKGITVTVLIIAAVALIYYLFTSLFGFGNRYGMMTGNNGYSMMGGAGGYGLGLAGLLAVLLKLLLAASVIGLIIGLVMYVKQSYGKEIAAGFSTLNKGAKPVIICSHCGKDTTDNFKYCPYCGKEVKMSCTSCGVMLNDEWKCCPVCGSEKDSASKEATSKETTSNEASADETKTETKDSHAGITEEVLSGITGDTAPESTSNPGDSAKSSKGKRSHE